MFWITLVIALAALPGIAFPIVYWATASWQNSSLGRALMLNGVSIGLIMALVVFTVLHGPDYPGRAIVRFGVYGLIAVMLWTQLLTYISAVRKVRQDQRKEDTPSVPKGS